MGKPGHLHRVFTVEPAHQRIGHAEHHRVQHGRQCQRGAAAQNEQLPGSGAVAVAVAAAHQRLGTLGHTVENGGGHQRKVGHDAVGRHGHIPGQTQQQEVEHRRGHAGGHLPHKAGDAQLAALPQQLCRGQLPHELHRVVFLEEVAAADGDAEHRRNGGGQCRTGQPQPHGEHEDVVEHHIEQAAAQRGHHGQRGRTVVADKGRHDVVAHKKGREQQKDARIGDAQRHDAGIAAHEPQQCTGAEDAHQHKGHGQQAGAKDGIGEIPLCRPLLALCAEDGVAGGRAQTDHGTDGKNEVVDGQAEVEQGHAVGARRLRDKIGIGQNIAGRAQQTENILRYIFKELLCQIHLGFPFFPEIVIHKAVL